jgi:hypothetical protein
MTDYPEITVTNIDVKKETKRQHAILLNLQAARTKANQKRKPKYQADIDAFFFGE